MFFLLRTIFLLIIIKVNIIIKTRLEIPSLYTGNFKNQTRELKVNIEINIIKYLSLYGS